VVEVKYANFVLHTALRFVRHLQTFHVGSASILLIRVLRWLQDNNMSRRRPRLTASILIVGDDPVLLHTRAELLRDWQIVTASSREAEEAILARTYDLLIFSKTAQEKVVRGLIDQARQLRPGSRMLAIRSGEEWQAGLPTYQVELNNPGGLRSAVAKILDSCPRPAEL
jgi:hypothetical protein